MLLRVHFLGPILAFSLLAHSARAQSTVNVAPSQIQSIKVYGPEAPEFAKHLTDLRVDAATRAAAAAVLSRSIVVSNTADRPVSKFVVRFEYINPAGKMYSENQWQEPSARFETGTSLLITPSRTLTESLRSHWPMGATLSFAPGSVLDAIVRSPVFRVSVDSVLFPDGDFYGPDAAQAWAKLSEEREFVRATRAELEALGTDLMRIQQKLVEIYRPIAERKPGQGLRVTMMRERMYGELMDLAKSGYEPFRTALQERFGDQTLTALRRKF